MMNSTASAPASAPRALDVAAVRELALAYNHAYLVRASKFEDVDVEAVESAIATGAVAVICGETQTHAGRYIVFANAVVKLAADSPLGEFAHIGEVVETTARLPKGMPSYKAGEWWARKHFGTSLPIEKISEFA